MNPIFKWVGSKRDIANWIIPFFPQHETYVEVFGGSGAILLSKPKSKHEIYNDRNLLLSNFFEVIRTKQDQFVANISLMPYSEVHNNRYFRNIIERCDELNDVEMAVQFFYLLCTSYHGKIDGGYGMFKGTSERIFHFEEKVPGIIALAKRLQNVQIWNKDFEEAIKNGDSEGSLIYLDPPYVETEDYYIALNEDRKKIFLFEDHQRLASTLSKIKGKCIISYEDHPVLREVLYPESDGWVFFSKEKNRSSKKEKASEIIICNFKPQNTLF